MHRISPGILPAAALLIAVMGANAIAAPVTYNISGTVLGGSLEPDVKAGDAFSGSFTYDPMETNALPLGIQTRYTTLPPHGLGIQIDSVGSHAGTYATDTSQQVQVLIVNDNAGNDNFNLDARVDISLGFNGGAPIAGAQGAIRLDDTDGTVFSDQSLPTSLTLSDFEAARLFIKFVDVDNDRSAEWRGYDHQHVFSRSGRSGSDAGCGVDRRRLVDRGDLIQVRHRNPRPRN